MILFGFVLALAFCFAAFTEFSMINFVVGLVLSVLILGFLPQIPRPHPADMEVMRSGRKFLQFFRNVVHFFFDFVVDLTVSNLQIAYEVWTPRDNYDPRLVYVPVKDLTDLELTVLSSRITLTPGTLSADVTADREHLVVHVMYGKGEDEEKIAQRMRMPIELLRRNITK